MLIVKLHGLKSAGYFWFKCRAYKLASRDADSEDTSGAFASTIKTGKPYIQTE